MNENLRLLRPFLRGLPIIILVVVMAILGAKKYLSYVTPMYESTAKLKLADIHEGVASTNLFRDLDVFATANKIATEIEVIKSSELIGKAIAELPFQTEIFRKGEMRTVELFNDSPFLVEGKFSDEEHQDKRFKVTIQSNKKFLLISPKNKNYYGFFGKPVLVENGKIVLTLNKDFLNKKKRPQLIDNYEIEFLSKQKLIDKINKDLDIVPVDKDVPVIRINLKSNIPEKAALFVNKITEMYIRDYIENKYKAATITTDFLEDKIDAAHEKLVNSETNIENYRNENNIINIRQETETDLRKISQMKIQQTNLKLSLLAIKDLNQYIESGKNNFLDLATNFEAFSDLLSTEMIKSMKKLQADKKELLLTYTPDNEKVKVVDDKINDLVKYQIESIKNTERNLQIKYNDLIKDIAESEKVFVGLPDKERMMTILDREFNMYQKNYNFLNEKRIEAEIAKSAKIAFHKIITPAEVSKTPVSPIRIIIIIVAAFLGLIGSTMLIYIVHFAKAKVNDAFTIEKNSTIPIAVSTPYLKNSKLVSLNFLKEALQLELKGIVAQKNILTLSSYDKSEHQLFHTKNLLIAFEKQNRKVLLVDATGELEDFHPHEHYINYADTSFLEYTKEKFVNEIQSKLMYYDLCLIHNQAIKDEKLALLFMSITNQNILVVDSRKTAEKSIIKLELLKDEFKLQNVWFLLNKEGYSPSVIAEIINFGKKIVKKYKK